MSANPQQQQGMVLVIALVLLLVLTLLGVSGINQALLQERMAGSAQLTHRALQAAEAGLRDGEKDVAQNILPTTVFYTNCANGLCQPAQNGEHVWQSDLIDWAAGNNVIIYGQNTGASELAGLAKQPRYIIERLHVVERNTGLKHGLELTNQGEWFRITAMGYGPYGRIEAMVQSVYRK